MRMTQSVLVAIVLSILVVLAGCVRDRLEVDLGPITFDPSLYTVTYQIVDQYMTPYAFQSVTACYEDRECDTAFTDMAGLASFPRRPGVSICLWDLENHVTIDGRHFDRAHSNEALCVPPAPSNATRTAISMRPPDFDAIFAGISVSATGIGTNDWLVESIGFSWPGYDLWGDLAVDRQIRVEVFFNCGNALRTVSGSIVSRSGSDWTFRRDLSMTSASDSKVVTAGVLASREADNAYCEQPIGAVLVTDMRVDWPTLGDPVWRDATSRTLATGVSGREP